MDYTLRYTFGIKPKFKVDYGTAYIYALVDPRDGIPRYVGSTINPYVRLSGHITESNTRSHLIRRCGWIKSIRDAGYYPHMVILEITPSQYTREREEFWIESLSHHDLLNGTKRCPLNPYIRDRIVDKLTDGGRNDPTETD